MIAEKSWEVSVEMSTEDDDTYDTHTARMNPLQTLCRMADTAWL